MAEWMIGIDTGGTFTDVAAFEPTAGRMEIAKVPSTPGDPSRGVLDGIRSLLERVPDLRTADIAFFAHGTTVATNAVLEHKGAPTGLLINRGYRALYELRGGVRPTGAALIDPFYEKPKPLVPQKFTQEITGRIAFDGSELEPLSEASVREAAAHFRAAGIRSIAVAFLFSFMNDAHEKRAAEILRAELPGCRVSLSSEIFPVIREYPRISTTVVDAYVGPVIETYLKRLAVGLRELGLTTRQLFIMQSSGGLMQIDLAARYPNQTLLSGPAAGVVYAKQLGRDIDEPDLITFDIGGTSTDIAVMPDGNFRETRQGKISGQDVGTPMIQIHTLGAGGGTIAYIGADGLLKAGPQSAGSQPGPACYGNGGTEATVTDANVVLGYLAAGGLAGGRVKIDVTRAREVIEQRVAKPLGLSIEQAAMGIIRIVNVNMEVGLRLSMAERGLDHRKFALVAFGGAGPVHAARVARDIGIPRVVVPPHPGISCAMGLLCTDVRHHYLRSRLAPLHDVSADELEQLFQALESRALADAQAEGFAQADVQLHRQADLRYPYQGYELTVPCTSKRFSDADRAQLRLDFDRLHEGTYGVSARDEKPDLVNVRVLSVSPVRKLQMPERERGGAVPDARALIGSREALFEESSEYLDTPVYRRDHLREGNVLTGPAIIEQFDSTTVVLPRQRVTVKRFGTLLIEVET